MTREGTTIHRESNPGAGEPGTIPASTTAASTAASGATTSGITAGDTSESDASVSRAHKSQLPEPPTSESRLPESQTSGSQRPESLRSGSGAIASDATVPTADIGVVVVSYQSASTLDECLSRLRTCAGVAAIRVVDNQSTDGTLEIVQVHACADPRLRFIANPDNPGFAVACNQGAADLAASAPACRWLAFVNPDLMVEAGSLLELRGLALSAEAAPAVDMPDTGMPDAGMPGTLPGPGLLLGADLVGEDGVRDPAARRRHPDFGAMLDARLAALRPARPADSAWPGDPLLIDADDTQRLQPVEAISGALMFLPRALFERVGGFDEAYRLHAEDLDLCRRIAATGAAIAVANRVRLLHVRGVSSRSRPVFVEWHKHRGLWRYFRKFEAIRRPRSVRAAVWLSIWLHFPLAVLRQRFRS